MLLGSQHIRYLFANRRGNLYCLVEGFFVSRVNVSPETLECLHLTAEKPIRERPQAERRRPGEKKRPPKFRKPGEPIAEDYVLGLETAVNLAPYMRDYVAGGKRAQQTVRSVVAGHYKNIPYGPRGGGLRRRDWIAPYARGGAGLPMIARRIRLPEDEGGQTENPYVDPWE